MILGIDASTVGSGGAKRHLIEVLRCFDPQIHGFSEIKIWGVNSLLDELPESMYIHKITHPYLNKGFLHRVLWQYFLRERAFKNQIDILFSPFGTYSGKVKPYVSMSRNMLVFDKTERARFGISWWRIKLKLLNLKQKQSFKNADGLIFLSNYAKATIQNALNNKDIKSTIVHHGVSQAFRNFPKPQLDVSNYSFVEPYKFLYVSTVWVYKHPWNVVEAVSNLRRKGYPIRLDFVGNNEQKEAGELLSRKLNILDPHGTFVSWFKNIKLNQISEYYKNADGFIFASTCENMPNILIEAMSAGLPIVCSSYPPMPEFLKEGGMYFDPTSVADIERCLEGFLLRADLRRNKVSLSYSYSKKYTWDKCANHTFAFLIEILNNSNRKDV